MPIRFMSSEKEAMCSGERAGRWATNVPLPCVRTSSPSLTSWPSASRTVIRLTP
jgi:hypothetical protein